MNNYQLYRTNAKLGGQVSWNLVLEDTANGKLVVKYFDLTPISPNIDYKYGQNRDCVRYSHQENLRTLYKEIQGQFYDAAIDPRLTTIYPIIDNDERDTRDSSLDMGCSRLSFSRYSKQLQVFCPVWLEDFSKDDELSFVISLYTYVQEDETILSSRQLTLKMFNDNSYHDHFVTYFKNYLNDIIEDRVIGDRVLNINTIDRFASIHGLDIRTGKLASKDISTLVPNLLERERPLMETDFMLIDNYHTSVMIAKQLFNFNLVFDIADLVSNTMSNMLRDDDFFIKVDVFKNGKRLQKRSFNNNYSSIKKPNVSFNNVFKYLRDDKCIDNIRDNKLAPDICHWTLNDNDKYIFNMYPGFGLIYEMFYLDAPNYWEEDTITYPNTLDWINCNDLTRESPGKQDVEEVLKRVIMRPNYTVFNVTQPFMKNTRIDIDNIHASLEEGETYDEEYLTSYIVTDNTTVNNICSRLEMNNISNYIFIVPDSASDTGVTFYVSDRGDISGQYILDHVSTIEEKGYVVFVSTQAANNYIFIATEKNKNMLSYKWMVNNIPYLYNYITEHSMCDYLKTVKTILDNVIYPNFNHIYNSLGIKKADSPWIENDEIYYVKVNDKSHVVIRYDGNIKPMFSKFDDLVIYRVRKMTADEFSKDPAFQNDQTQGFLPNYPSTGYFNLEVVDDDSSDDSLHHFTYNEYKWFDNSLVFNLIPTISVRLFSKYLPHYYSNDELIDKVLTDTYPNLSSRYMSYLRSLYDVEISYEYDEPAWNVDTHRFDYIYTITLKLK